MATNLEELKDHKRVLIIFATSDEKDIFKWQMREINNYNAGILDRDMHIIYVVEEGISKSGEDPLDENAENELRKKFSVKPKEFVAILLAKDGSLKYKDDKPVAMEDIFSIIDALPQRKKELEERRNREL